MKLVFALIKYFVCSILLFLSSVISIITGVLSPKLSYFVYVQTCKLVLRVLGVSTHQVTEFNGYFNKGPYVFLGLNQESPIETFLWPAMIPIYSRYFLNLEFTLVPFLGWSFISMRNFIIVRQRKEHAKKVLEKAVSYLRSSPENGVCIQLDGYMRSDNQIGPYKKGGIILAIKSQAKIVPIAIHGSKECLRRGSIWVNPGEVSFKMLQPIDTQGFSVDQKDELRDELKDIARKEFPAKTIL